MRLFYAGQKPECCTCALLQSCAEMDEECVLDLNEYPED